ncbi:hypothetical protein PFISCL1PPCAC_14564, partial [Pristionchus fissidentatus]
TLGLLNDVIAQLVFDPLFLLPLPCVTRFENNHLQFYKYILSSQIVWLIVVAEQGPAYIACFIHRHQAVLPPSTHWRLSKRAKIALLTFLSLIMITPVPLLWVRVLFEAQQFCLFQKFLSPDWPSDLLDRTVCSSFELIQRFAFLSSFLNISVILIVVSIVVHTFQQLGQSHLLSEKQRYYQRIMIRILILQYIIKSLIPAVVLIPNVAGFAVLVFGWSGSAVYPVILLILSTNSTNSFTHSAVLLGTTPLYRGIIKSIV